MTDKELYLEVIRRPDVLYAVNSNEYRIVGPWQRGNQSSRYTPGRVLALAAVVRLGYSSDWQGFCLGETTPAHGPMSRAAAEYWCDERLRNDGWILAEYDIALSS